MIIDNIGSEILLKILTSCLQASMLRKMRLTEIYTTKSRANGSFQMSSQKMMVSLMILFQILQMTMGHYLEELLWRIIIQMMLKRI